MESMAVHALKRVMVGAMYDGDVHACRLNAGAILVQRGN
jgi:hypothetical protein